MRLRFVCAIKHIYSEVAAPAFVERVGAGLFDEPGGLIEIHDLLDAGIEVLLGEPIGTVSSDLFSHFTEHLGGCIYDAVFYDDIFFVEYFYSKLRPCWRRNDREIGELLQTAVREYATLLEKCEQFDKELVSGLERTGGEAYAPGTWS